jgi:NADH-quinone oxidoreductase subunit M
VILSAVYALTLTRKVIFGPLDNPKLADIQDLDGREWTMFLPLAAALLILGVAPMIALDFTAPVADAIVTQFNLLGLAQR